MAGERADLAGRQPERVRALHQVERLRPAAAVVRVRVRVRIRVRIRLRPAAAVVRVRVRVRIGLGLGLGLGSDLPQQWYVVQCSSRHDLAGPLYRPDPLPKSVPLRGSLVHM